MKRANLTQYRRQQFYRAYSICRLIKHHGFTINLYGEQLIRNPRTNDIEPLRLWGLLPSQRDLKAASQCLA
jgi:hypothetical protein